MENPPEKKQFPWGLVALGCGVVVILGLAMGVVLVFKALPAVRSALANLDSALVPTQAAPTQAPRIGPTQEAPLVIPTEVPNSGGGSGTTIEGLPFKFSAVQDLTAASVQSLMDQMTSTLNLNNDTDFMAPKSYKGSAILDPTTSFTVGNGWCAADMATLNQNLADMQFQLSINGKTIDLSQYPALYFSDAQGDACAMTGLLITPNGNMSGTYHIVLTQKYLKSLSDGIISSPYPAGDVIFDFFFQFKASPSGGSST